MIDAKFPLEAWNAIRARGEPRGDQGGRGAVPPRHAEARPGHRRALLRARRDPGHGLHVRAVGIDLRRHPRALRGRRPARPPGAGGDRLAVAADAVDPGGACRCCATSACASRRTSSRRRSIRLMEDVRRLDDRVRGLQRHFGQANKDIDEILDLDRQGRPAAARRSRRWSSTIRHSAVRRRNR